MSDAFYVMEEDDKGLGKSIAAKFAGRCTPGSIIFLTTEEFRYFRDGGMITVPINWEQGSFGKESGGS